MTDHLLTHSQKRDSRHRGTHLLMLLGVLFVLGAFAGACDDESLLAPSEDDHAEAIPAGATVSETTTVGPVSATVRLTPAEATLGDPVVLDGLHLHRSGRPLSRVPLSRLLSELDSKSLERSPSPGLMLYRVGDAAEGNRRPARSRTPKPDAEARHSLRSPR